MFNSQILSINFQYKNIFQNAIDSYHRFLFRKLFDNGLSSVPLNGYESCFGCGRVCVRVKEWKENMRGQRSICTLGYYMDICDWSSFVSHYNHTLNRFQHSIIIITIIIPFLQESLKYEPRDFLMKLIKSQICFKQKKTEIRHRPQQLLNILPQFQA